MHANVCEHVVKIYLYIYIYICIYHVFTPIYIYIYIYYIYTYIYRYLDSLLILLVGGLEHGKRGHRFQPR